MTWESCLNIATEILKLLRAENLTEKQKAWLWQERDKWFRLARKIYERTK